MADACADNSPRIAPMGWWRSTVFFGGPTAVVAMAFWVLRPQLEAHGLDPLPAYLISVALPLAGLGIAAVAGCGPIEGRPLRRRTLAVRLRFQSSATLDWRSILLVVGVSGVASLALAGLVGALSAAGVLPVPDSLPPFIDPREAMTSSSLDHGVTGGLAGRWDMAALFLLTYVANIVGEELWWRGYVLPRQEHAFGERAWLVHGTMWAGFHAFKWWDVLPLLPMCLLIARLAQRHKSSWPALIAHATLNLAGLIAITLAVAT